MPIYELELPQELEFSQIVDLEISLLHYGTVLGGDIYFSRQYRRDNWRDASDADKQKLLYQATQHIELLNFLGDKTDANQPLQFPRGGDTIVPMNIENAVYEEAYQILLGRDYEHELNQTRIQKQQFGPVSTSYFSGQSPIPNVAAGILSSVAWRFLHPYLRQAEEIQLMRV